MGLPKYRIEYLATVLKVEGNTWLSGVRTESPDSQSHLVCVMGSELARRAGCDGQGALASSMPHI